MRKACYILLLLSSAARADGTYNGGVYPPVAGNEAATTSGRGWSVATGSIAVASGNELDAVLTNPNSGTCKAVITFRRYSNPNGSALQFQTFSNPTAITTNTATVGSRTEGAPPFTGMSFGYVSRAAGSMGGTAGVAAPLLANSEEDITIPIVLNPGSSVGVALTGLTGALSSSVTVAATFVGYCL